MVQGIMEIGWFMIKWVTIPILVMAINAFIIGVVFYSIKDIKEKLNNK